MSSVEEKKEFFKSLIECKFKKGDCVSIIAENKIKNGIVIGVYDLDVPVVAVALDEGSTIKVPAYRVAKREENKGVITITREEFTDVASEIIADKVVNRPLSKDSSPDEVKSLFELGIIVSMVVAFITNELFGDVEDNDESLGFDVDDLFQDTDLNLKN